MPEPVELEFVPSAAVLSLGVEQELQVLDARTLRLTPRAPEILERAHDLRLDKEMFRSTIELVTGVCGSVREAVARPRSDPLVP